MEIALSGLRDITRAQTFSDPLHGLPNTTSAILDLKISRYVFAPWAAGRYVDIVLAWACVYAPDARKS